MNSETNNQKDLGNIKEDTDKLDTTKNDFDYSQLEQIANNLQMMKEAVVSVIQSNVINAVIDLGNRIAELVASVDFTPI